MNLLPQRIQANSIASKTANALNFIRIVKQIGNDVEFSTRRHPRGYYRWGFFRGQYKLDLGPAYITSLIFYHPSQWRVEKRSEF